MTCSRAPPGSYTPGSYTFAMHVVVQAQGRASTRRTMSEVKQNRSTPPSLQSSLAGAIKL